MLSVSIKTKKLNLFQYIYSYLLLAKFLLVNILDTELIERFYWVIYFNL